MVTHKISRGEYKGFVQKKELIDKWDIIAVAYFAMSLPWQMLAKLSKGETISMSILDMVGMPKINLFHKMGKICMNPGLVLIV